MQAPRGSDHTPASDTRMVDGFPLSLSTAIFPVGGARSAGVPTDITHPTSLVGDITPDQLHRHQSSHNGTDTNSALRVGAFPIPGAIRTRSGGGTTIEDPIPFLDDGQEPSNAGVGNMAHHEILRHQSSTNGPDINANLNIGTFPVTGARRTGSGGLGGIPSEVPYAFPDDLRDFSDTPGVRAMTPEELHRHQSSVNGPNLSHVGRLGSFPIPGARSARSKHHHGLGTLTVPSGDVREGQAGPNIYSRPASKNENFDSFLQDMPSSREDSTRHVMFTELIRLKTRTLELQIAEARQKEREAELELAKFKAEVESHGQSLPISTSMAGGNGNVPGQNGMEININPFVQSTPNNQQSSMTSYGYRNQPGPSLSGNNLMGSAPNVNQPLAPENAPTPITSYDLEAMMHDQNIDNLFSWLPDFTSTEAQQTTVDPSGLFLPSMPTTITNPIPLQQAPPASSTTSPTKKRSPSPSSDASSPHPTKRTKRTTEKKAIVEQHSNCLRCFSPIGKILIRAPKSQIPENILICLSCTSCVPVYTPNAVGDHTPMGSNIGTVDMRKRMRVSMEIDDEDKRLADRRTFCDVCQRLVASGQILGGNDGESMSHMAEVICGACDAKYQRCTDCGGGGGPRVGIGKWRMKQVFQPGRKTCGLSHSRLGDRPREIGVHVTPTDFNEQQLKEVLLRTKGLWQEKTLARLAVPEMLEIDLPPETINPLQDYNDVEDIITRNWPTREAMICATGMDAGRFQRLLSLTWAHAKPRRTVRSVDIEEEYAKNADNEDEADMSTVLANVKRTNIVIPPGSELVGMWGGEWDMEHGSLLISTLIPFEGADGEDSTALSVGEMITKVQALRLAINSERQAAATANGTEPDLLPQCEHLWVVSGGTMPLIRERVADVLIRKRSFVHVEEYLTRHPEFKNALDARPYGLHPDLHRPLKGQMEGEEEENRSEPLILVRWLGKDFDTQKILEIKQQEFGGGKAKLKKKSKGK